MVALPPVAPVTGWCRTARLPRDHYVRLDANDYSVHPSVVGRRVTVVADLEQVSVYCDGVEVPRHRRCWARHQSITDPAHAAAAVELRAARRLAAVPTAMTEVEQRSLADYDRMFASTPTPTWCAWTPATAPTVPVPGPRPRQQVHRRRYSHHPHPDRAPRATALQRAPTSPIAASTPARGRHSLRSGAAIRPLRRVRLGGLICECRSHEATEFSAPQGQLAGRALRVGESDRVPSQLRWVSPSR